MSMEAHVCRRYGGPEVVHLSEVPTPTPRTGEVLVKVLATTVTAADWRVRTLEVPRGLGLVARLALGPTRPRQPILGTELAGVVEAVGEGVTRFAPGDEVMAFTGSKMGAHAQYVALAERGPLVAKPAKLSFEEAASLCFGGTTAIHFLRRAGLRTGERVLVVGASGGVGTSLVQLARHQGAEVTGVTSGRNAELVRSLGATAVVDYDQEDYLASAARYDVIADTVGAATYARSRHLLAPGGRYLSIAGGLGDLLASARDKRVVAGPAPDRPEAVAEVARLAEEGALRPVIDRVYEWDQMREAHAYVETRRKRGSVVVRVRHVERGQSVTSTP